MSIAFFTSIVSMQMPRSFKPSDRRKIIRGLNPNLCSAAAVAIPEEVCELVIPPMALTAYFLARQQQAKNDARDKAHTISKQPTCSICPALAIPEEIRDLVIPLKLRETCFLAAQCQDSQD